MATILAFPPAARGEPQRRQRPLPGNTSAEIVFFPGVRYERWVSGQPAAKRRKRNTRRDRIELEA